MEIDQMKQYITNVHPEKKRYINKLSDGYIMYLYRKVRNTESNKQKK